MGALHCCTQLWQCLTGVALAVLIASPVSCGSSSERLLCLRTIKYMQYISSECSVRQSFHIFNKVSCTWCMWTVQDRRYTIAEKVSQGFSVCLKKKVSGCGFILVSQYSSCDFWLCFTEEELLFVTAVHSLCNMLFHTVLQCYQCE